MYYFKIILFLKAITCSVIPMKLIFAVFGAGFSLGAFNPISGVCSSQYYISGFWFYSPFLPQLLKFGHDIRDSILSPNASLKY